MEIFFVLIRIVEILTSQNQSHQHINGVGYQVLASCKHLCVSSIETCPSLSSFNEEWEVKDWRNTWTSADFIYQASVTSVNFVTWDQAKIKYHLALCHEIWLKICHWRSVKIKYPCQVATSAHTIIQCHCLFQLFIKILHVWIYINTSPFILNDNAICFIPFLDFKYKKLVTKETQTN